MFLLINVRYSAHSALYAEVHDFVQNLGATSKFSAPERWHGESSKVSAQNSGVICEPPWLFLLGANYMIHIFCI
jgi:hypothetical protein